MFYSVGIFRTSDPRDSISSDPEGTAPRRQGWGCGWGWVGGVCSSCIEVFDKCQAV